MIKSIFYTWFDQAKGTSVLHQVPEGSIIPSESPAAQSPLFDFSSISEYVIPSRGFYERLVTVCVNRYRVLGYPVYIEHERYATSDTLSRGEFIFNFCIVLEEDAEQSSYVPIVRKLGMLFRNLEEQSCFLSDEKERLDGMSADERAQEGGGKVYALCEVVFEDLNNYCECMIPIDDYNTLNLKLFPARHPPPPIYGWHVPLSTVRLSTLAAADGPGSWDLTLMRVIPFIDGILSVAQIARLADVDFRLARKAIAHLAYYGCLILLDIFQFGAVYAPTASFGAFVADTKMQTECTKYVVLPHAAAELAGRSAGRSRSREASSPYPAAMGGSDRIGDVVGGSRSSRSPRVRESSHSRRRSRSFSRLRSSSAGLSLRPGGLKLTDGELDPDAYSRHQADEDDYYERNGRRGPEPRKGKQQRQEVRSLDHLRMRLIELYASLRQGLLLRHWCLENHVALDGIDVRRLITFGVIKGFLYRVHKYAITTNGHHAHGDGPQRSKIPIAKAPIPAASATTPATPAPAPATAVVTGAAAADGGRAEKDGSQPRPGYFSNQNRRRSRQDGGVMQKNRPEAGGKGPRATDGGADDSASTDSGVATITPAGPAEAISGLPTGAAATATGTGVIGAGAAGAIVPALKSGRSGNELPLARYLNGLHCFDQICTELEMAEKEVMAKLKGYGDVQIVFH